MSSNLYKLYIDGIYEIAETLVYKHGLLADKLNQTVFEKGLVVNLNDKTTWKYYQNMAGIYHETDMEEISIINSNGSPYMQIKIASNTGSIDVDFTTALIDPITGNVSIANEYQYGSYLYKELLTRYPDHEELILGILNPIPLTVSIPAMDGDILYCGGYHRRLISDSLGDRSFFEKPNYIGLNDKHLIEDNEIEIIPAIEAYIKNYLERWHNVDYNAHHNLYLGCLVAAIAGQIPSVIFNERLKRIHSNETHSFLIREYLESNGRLSQYIPALPLKQTLYLYRNLNYLMRYVGKQEAFDALVDNIATPCRVPLAGYTLRHNLTRVPEELLPTAVIRRETINFRQSGTGRDAVDIHNLLLREVPLARDNEYNLDNVELAIESKVTLSQNNRMPTKIIDSQMLDVSDNHVFNRLRVLYDLWAYSSYADLYTGVLYVSNPLTGDRLSLTPKNALILAIYCLHKGYYNQELTVIPSIRTSMIPRSKTILHHPDFHLLPTASELLTTINSPFIDLSYCQQMIGNDYEVPTMNSGEAFVREGVKIHNEIKRRYAMSVSQLDAYARAKTEYGMSTLYWLNIPTPLSSLTYPQWFAQTGISLSGLSNDSYINLATEVIKQALGNLENTNQLLQDLQNAVIGLLRHFSSYTTQFVSSINNTGALITQMKTIRGANIKESFGDRIRMRPARMLLRNVSITPVDQVTISSNTAFEFTE